MRASAVLFAATALVLAALSAPAPAQEGGRPAVIVTLGDGTTFPMRPWSLSYGVASWRQGSSPAFANYTKVEVTELLLGRKTYPTSGVTLSITYDIVERERESADGGEPEKIKAPVARSLTLVGPDGKKTAVKPEPPARDLVMPSADKSLLVQVRSLELRGQTVTGSKRDICLLSFTSLEECNDTVGQQVVKIEFPK
jgi:hypothetical protein